MKTKLLVATTLTALLSTGLYAGNNSEDKPMMKKQMHQGDKSCKKQDGKRMMKKAHKRNQDNPLSLLRQLNLTADQHKEIRKIKQDLMKKRVTVNTAFTSTSFDKAKFIQIMKDKKENSLKKKAELIDKVYNVLTSKQKEQFKVLLDLKTEKKMKMMEKRMNHKDHREKM